MLTKLFLAMACSGACLVSVAAADVQSTENAFGHKSNAVHSVKSYSYGQEQRETQSQKININRASAEELAAALRGVGMARARAIVKLREELGQFTDVEQLLQVRGLGVKVLNDNREKITL